MNWSVDWIWWRKDPREQLLSKRLQGFFKSQDIRSYGNKYALDGTMIDSGHSTGLVATNAVASLAVRGTVAKEFVEELWKVPVPSNLGERYYSGLLYLMGLLHCSGEFKAYVPPSTD